MDLKINNQTLLKEIHTAFQAEFPFLDIAFFSTTHHPGEASAKGHRLPLNLSVGDAGDPHRIGELFVTPDTTVGELENHLELQFGLHVQVLKKSGNIWLQTTISDQQSLKDLNKITKESNEVQPLPDEEIDYHEQE